MESTNPTRWLLAVGVIGVIAFLLFRSQPATSQNTSPSDSQSMSYNDGTEQETMLGDKRYTQAPEQFLDANKKYQVTMKTSEGEMVIDLFHTETPIAANNFAFLVKDGFYDGLTFHRIVKDFMIQGGDPDGDGTGGPGYRIKDEAVTRDYDRGVIAYANSGANTSGSQFFIMHKDYPLPKNYIIFGQVTKGLETIDKIAETPVETNMFGENSSPTEPVFIESATLSEVQ